MLLASTRGKLKMAPSLIFGLARIAARGKYTREETSKDFFFYEAVFVKKGLRDEMNW